MSAVFQRLISRSYAGSNLFTIARGTREGWHDTAPALLAKHHGIDQRPSLSQLFHSAPPSQERVRTHDSIHKETLRHEIINTHVSGGNGVSLKHFADYDLGGRVFIATGDAQGLGLSMAAALAETGGKCKFA